MNPPRKLFPPTTAKAPASILRNPFVAPSSPSRRRETLAGGIVPADHGGRDNPDDGQAFKAGSVAALKLMKKAHQALSSDNFTDGSGSLFTEAAHVNTTTGTSSRRHASMPQSRTTATLPADPGRIPGSETPSPSPAPAPMPPLNQAQIDIANDRRARARGSLLPNPGSPPIVDFTRLEDTYRGPRSGTFEGLVPGTRAGVRSVSGGYCFGPDGTAAAMKMKDRYPAITPARAGGTAAHHPASTTTATSVPAVGWLAPAPASARKPDPRRVLSALEGMLGDEYKICDYLHAHELLGMHQLDQLDFEERDRARVTFVKTGKLHVRRGEKGVISVLGEPIRAASIYASVPVVLSGREHEIPIVVVNTVEELYRTGIYQANLFRRLPNRGRLMELINIYDSEDAAHGAAIRQRQPASANSKAAVHPGFGALTSLHLESTPDVCALLTTYISSLREPVLCRFLFGAIWDWCGVADELEPETDEHGTGTGTGGGRGSRYPASSFAPRLSSIPLARTYTSPEDATRIATAQLLLHLLPSPHFSLLVYLLAFFSQVALVREENGVGVADLARMYGAKIFGGDAAVPVKLEGTNRTRARDGETMMRWFLRRWGPLSEGLFDALDDANMGLFRRTHARRDSFGKDVLSSWSSIDGVSKGEEDEEDDAEAVSGGVGVEDAEDEDESVLDSLTAVRDRAFGRRATPAAKATRASDYFAAGLGTGDEARASRSKLLRAHSISDRSLSDLGMNTGEEADESVMLSSARNQGDDTLDISHLPPASKGQMNDSRSNEGLDGRLLDLSMSELMNEVMCFPSNEHDRELSGQPAIPEIIINSGTPPNQTPPQQRSPESVHLPAPVSEAITKCNPSPRSARSTIIAPSKPSSTQETGGAATVEGEGRGELEEALDTISGLKAENATLHNTVWRLEAELAQVRREFYAASASGSRTPAQTAEISRMVHDSDSARGRGKGTLKGGGDGVDGHDTEAVRIVAEIRRLMAKN